MTTFNSHIQETSRDTWRHLQHPNRHIQETSRNTQRHPTIRECLVTPNDMKPLRGSGCSLLPDLALSAAGCRRCRLPGLACLFMFSFTCSLQQCPQHGATGSSDRGHSRRGRCTRRPTPKESTQQNHPHVTLTSLNYPAPLPHISSHTHLPAPAPSQGASSATNLTQAASSATLLRGGCRACPRHMPHTPHPSLGRPLMLYGPNHTV